MPSWGLRPRAVQLMVPKERDEGTSPLFMRRATRMIGESACAFQVFEMRDMNVGFLGFGRGSGLLAAGEGTRGPCTERRW